MMTPTETARPEISGMKLMVSSEARHRKALTATPVPLLPAGVGPGAEQPPGPKQAPLFLVAAARDPVVASRACDRPRARPLFLDRTSDRRKPTDGQRVTGLPSRTRRCMRKPDMT
jgi:hypothetical protein